ncbi:MAG: sugar phosphate isomerase/epimerase family protein [Planctomycetota bacterium]
MHALDRRNFLQHAATAASVGLAGGKIARAAGGHSSGGHAGFEICAFEKFLQDLSFDELADTIQSLGFSGIEATVRNKGHIQPERVEEELPKMVEALQQRGLEVTIMTSDVLSPDQPLTEKVLRTAASLGIKRYRMGFYFYDLKKPVMEQLDAIRPAVKELAAMNREIGVSALYQNHSDAKFVGATLWDLHRLLEGVSPDEIACAFDIRHTTIEAGLAWPILYDIMKPHIGALFVKDFQWKGKKAQHVPLGTGRVNPDFFKTVQQDGFNKPISLHVEYLKKEGTQANIDALRRDMAVLQDWLKA